MKVILLFALFGLSFCQDDACSGQKVSNPGGGNCLVLALKETSKLGPALAELACEYYKEEKNEENIKAAFKKVGDILECAGCIIGELISNPTLSDLLKGAPVTVEKLGEGLTALLDSLHLSEPVFKAACALAGKLLASDCLKKALASDTTGVILGLKDLYCKLKKSGAADAAANAAQLLGRLPCLLGELGLENIGDLEQTLGLLDLNSLKGLLEQILNLPGVGVVGGLLCPVLGK